MSNLFETPVTRQVPDFHSKPKFTFEQASYLNSKDALFETNSQQNVKHSKTTRPKPVMNLDISGGASQSRPTVLENISTISSTAPKQSRNLWPLSLVFLVVSLCLGKYFLLLKNRVQYCPTGYNLSLNPQGLNCTKCPLNTECDDSYILSCNEGFKFNYEQTACVKDEEITNQARSVLHRLDIVL